MLSLDSDEQFACCVVNYSHCISLMTCHTMFACCELFLVMTNISSVSIDLDNNDFVYKCPNITLQFVCMSIYEANTPFLEFLISIVISVHVKLKMFSFLNVNC